MAEAEQFAQTDPAAAMPALEAAIKSYERTLRLDGDSEEAAYHLERARALLDELRRQAARESGDAQDEGDQQQDQRQQQPRQQQDQQDGSGQGSDQQQPQEQQPQQEAPPDRGQQNTGTPPQAAEGPRSDEEADAVARQIIAAEEALAAMLERNGRQMEPVARDW